MADLPDLKTKVRADTSDLDRLEQSVDRAARNSENRMKKLGDSFKDAGDRLTKFASLPIAAGMAFSTKAASDLNEAMNVTKITFGESSAEIDKFVKTSATGLGQSERAAREATAQFGGLLQNLGYTNDAAADQSILLTRLASDLGSSFNKDPAVAVEALGSALRGESEPIRQFNVMLDDASVRTKAVQMGLAATSAEVDKNGLAQARLALIMEQTNRYQGDFANTSEGLANKSRILRAELEDTGAKLGQDLIPFAVTAAHSFQDLIDVFSGLTESQRAVVLGLGAFLVALGPSLTLIGNVTLAVNGLTAAYSRLGLLRFAGIGALGATLAGLGIAYTMATGDAERFIATAEKDIDTNNLDSLAGSFAKVRAEADKSSEGSFKVLGLTFNRHAFETNRLAEELVKLRDQYQTVNQATENFAATSGMTTDEVTRLAEKFGIDLTGSVSASQAALEKARIEISSGTLESEKLNAATTDLNDKVKTATERYEDFQDALDSALGGIVDSQQATLDLKERTLDLGEAYREAGGKADINTEKGRALMAALYDTVPAIEKEVEALTVSGQISGEASAQKQAIIDRLQNLRKEYPQLGPVIQGYIDKVNSIPGEKLTVAKVDTAEARRRVDELISKLNETRVIAGSIGTATLLQKLGTGNVQARATGGPVDPGKWYMVGENGPEMLFTGRSSGYVASAQATQAITRGPDGATVTIGDINLYGVQDAAGVAAVVPRLTDAIRAAVGAR